LIAPNHLGHGGARWGGIGCNAEKSGQEEPPEELFVGLAEEVVVAFGCVDAGEPADVGVGPEGGGDYWLGRDGRGG
jgi:hypothetical protein